MFFSCKAECFFFRFSGVDGKNFRDQEMSKAEISDEESGLDSCLSRPSHEIMV